MIEPSKVKEAFKRIEEENYAFRAYLKNHAGEDELAPVAAFLRMVEKDFRDKYIKEEFGDYQLNVRPCCFLKEDGGCQIEVCKPTSCRDYPYTDKP